MKPRVLVISDFRSFLSTRPEAEIFLGLHERGFEIEVMTYDEGEYVRRFREAGIKVIGFHPERKCSLRAIRRIRRELLDFKPHILQLYNSKAMINGLLAAWGLPVKNVLYRGFIGNIHWYDPAMYIKYFSPRVDKIVCNAEAVEELFHDQYFFDKSKTIVINKGHEVSWYQGTETIDLEEEFGIPVEAFVAVCVANARKMKDIPTQLKAFHHLPEEAPIHLILVGRGMDTTENVNIIERLPHPERIHFAGFRNDALRIVAASDVFVLTSTHGESLTKAVIEAMSLGIPPIITSIPGNREVVVDGESGLVIPPQNPEALAEAVRDLFEHPEKKERLGQQAYHRIDTRLSNRRSIGEYANLYESLASDVQWK